MSQKITKESVAAFLAGKPFNKANMSVRSDAAMVCLYLHGNCIARKMLCGDRRLEITDAGWPTQTTRKRLNGLPGVAVCQKNGAQYLNGQVWNGNWIAIN